MAAQLDDSALGFFLAHGQTSDAQLRQGFGSLVMGANPIIQNYVTAAAKELLPFILRTVAEASSLLASSLNAAIAKISAEESSLMRELLEPLRTQHPWSQQPAEYG